MHAVTRIDPLSTEVFTLFYITWEVIKMCMIE